MGTSPDVRLKFHIKRVDASSPAFVKNRKMPLSTSRQNMEEILTSHVIFVLLAVIKVKDKKKRNYYAMIGF